MFRQKQTPRGNNLPKKCPTNAKQKPRENTHAEEWSPKSCRRNFIEITPPHRFSPANSLHTHKTLPQKNISGGLLLYWYSISKNLEVRFRQKKLIKSKDSWDYCFNWLWSLKTFVYIIWQNFLVREKRKTCLQNQIQ